MRAYGNSGSADGREGVRRLLRCWCAGLGARLGREEREGIVEQRLSALGQGFKDSSDMLWRGRNVGHWTLHLDGIRATAPRESQLRSSYNVQLGLNRRRNVENSSTHFIVTAGRFQARLRPD